NTTTNPTPITASGVRTFSPSRMPIHTIAEAKATISTSAARLGPRSWARQPTISPVPRTTTLDTAMPSSSAMNWPLSYARRGGAAGRRARGEAVDDAFADVGGHRRGRADQAERQRLDEDAADEVLAVVAADRHRPAEDVREKQHEHQRLQRDVEQLFGDLADV